MRLLAAALVVLLCAGEVQAERPDSDFATLVDWMTGSFSSQAQSLEDEEYFDIRLEMVAIWPMRSDGLWLYVEQASASALDRPYRQREGEDGRRGGGRSERSRLFDDRFLFYSNPA